MSGELDRKSLKQTVNELNIELTRLEGNITFLEEEREKTEYELKQFIDKLQVKAQSWKTSLEEKEQQLKKLRAMLKAHGAALLEDGGSNEELERKSSASDAEQETTKLLHVSCLQQYSLYKGIFFP